MSQTLFVDQQSRCRAQPATIGHDVGIVLACAFPVLVDGRFNAAASLWPSGKRCRTCMHALV